MSSKKKILIIPSWYPTSINDFGGSFFREQAILLSKIFDVQILCFNYVYEYKKMPLYLKIFNKLKIINIQNTTKYKSSRIEITTLDDVVPTYIVRCYNNSNENHLESFMSDEFIENLKKKYFDKENYRPDIIHAQSTVYAGIYAKKIAEYFDVPYMITEHYGPFLTHKYTNTFRSYIQNTIEKAHKIQAVSHHQKRSILMQEFKCYPEVIGNLINEEYFYASKKIQKNECFNILTVGNNSFIKDAETFVKSINILLKKYNNIIVSIIGSVKNEEDKDMCAYYTYAKKFGIEKYFHILGAKKRNEILLHYQSCDVFVSTSIAESFGISVCEAILCEKMVVMVDNGACQDFITHNENALVCEIQDFQQIADYLLKVIKKEISFDSKKNRDKLIQKYGKDVFLKKMTDAYNNIIKK